MAFSEIERKRIESAVGGMCQRRNRPELHDKLRLEYSVDRHDLEKLVAEVGRDRYGCFFG